MSLDAINEARQNPPGVGWWYAECCAHGLIQITTEEELQMFFLQLDDDGFKSLFEGCWPTYEIGLADLQERGLGLDP